MPAYDFEVDLEALVKAAQGAADAVQAKKDKDVEDYVPTEGDLGSDVVWSAVDEFQERWERGVNDMTDDIEEVAGRLGKVAMSYGEFDRQGSEGLQKVASGMASLRIVSGS